MTVGLVIAALIIGAGSPPEEQTLAASLHISPHVSCDRSFTKQLQLCFLLYLDVVAAAVLVHRGARATLGGAQCPGDTGSQAQSFICKA